MVTAVVYAVSLAVTGAIAAITVLVIAGPHAGLLPAFLEPVVLVLGWAAVLVLPIWISVRIWRHLGPTET
jgi:hypothetical protein